MENKDYNIKLNNISESELEGVKQFIKTQLDEMVLPYIYANKLMLVDRENEVYQEDLKINADIEKLFEIYANELISQEEKKEQINNLLIELYARTKKLIISVSSGQNKKNIEELNQFKIK